MAVQDTNFFKIIFEAVEQFYKNPDKTYVIIRGRFIAKKPILKLVRYLLPQYRPFIEDSELVKQLFLNKDQDINLRAVLNPDTPPVLSETSHAEFENLSKVPESEQESAQEVWVSKLLLPSPVRDFTKRVDSQTLKVGNAAGGLLRSGGGLAAKAGGFATQTALRGIILLGSASGGGIFIAFLVALIIVAVLVFVVPVILSSSALLPPYQQTAGAQTITGSPVPTPSPSITYIPRAGSGIISCPVNDGRVIYGSREAGGHCSTGYGFDCVAPGQAGYTGRDMAVDVRGSSRTVFLPSLGGQQVEWTVDESGTAINDSEGGGLALAARSTFSGKSYRIRFVHLESINRLRSQPRSGTAVGQHTTPTQANPRNANHVHITIQEDGTYRPADLYFNLCR